ncbi:helix-turn-helix domain-containing protein [Eubacteriaceae bacterium ES2]|nr:helix-turn-helix domain-containing protein [Eubacteriaceae bacterium ES2]
MKLNMDILIDDLFETFFVENYGYYSDKMAYSLREYYDGGNLFQANHIYVVSPNLLPVDPIFEEGTMIISSDGTIPEQYYSSKVALLVLKTDKSTPSIFNTVSRIFEKYEQWDLALQRISLSTENNTLDNLLKASLQVFKKTLFIIDGQLNVLSVASPPNSGSGVMKYNRNINIVDTVELNYYANYYKNLIITDWKKREVYLSNVFTPTLCISLYDKEDYLATCNIQAIKNKDGLTNQDPFKDGEKALLKHLSNYLIHAYKQYQSVKEKASWKTEIFNKSISGINPGNLKGINKKFAQYKNEEYTCIVCQSGNDVKFLPIKYLCKKIEKHLNGTIALEKENMIVILVSQNETIGYQKSFLKEVVDFLNELDFKCGISEEYNSIIESYSYYIQALEALDVGLILKPDAKNFYFRDYLLQITLKTITNKLPFSVLCSNGIIELIRYDEQNNTSYFEELQVYLRNNLNAALTAKECFIHRHTFYNHLKQIVDILQFDFEDPNDIFFLQLSYKLFEFENLINGKGVSSNTNISLS